MNKLYIILLLTLSSCFEIKTEVEYIPIVSDEMDSIVILADNAIAVLKSKNKDKQRAQKKFNQKVLDIIHIRKEHKDSIDELRRLKLINRDSVVYNYNIELVKITDTVRITLVDSVFIPIDNILCSICKRKVNKKSIFNIFKKNN